MTIDSCQFKIKQNDIWFDVTNISKIQTDGTIQSKRNKNTPIQKQEIISKSESFLNRDVGWRYFFFRNRILTSLAARSAFFLTKSCFTPAGCRPAGQQGFKHNKPTPKGLMQRAGGSIGRGSLDTLLLLSKPLITSNVCETFFAIVIYKPFDERSFLLYQKCQRCISIINTDRLSRDTESHYHKNVRKIRTVPIISYKWFILHHSYFSR